MLLNSKMAQVLQIVPDNSREMITTQRWLRESILHDQLRFRLSGACAPIHSRKSPVLPH